MTGPQSDLGQLPPLVAAMREAIVSAAASGRFEALRIPIERNETPPLFARGARRPPGYDPLVALRGRAFDAGGREIMGLLQAVLAQPYVRITRGPSVSFGWPAFGYVAPPLPMREEDIIARWACVRFADLGGATAAGGPLIQRLEIGADGTWHLLLAAP